jgi:hypothetical protein
MANPHGPHAAQAKCAKLAEEHRKKHVQNLTPEQERVGFRLYREYVFVQENLVDKHLRTLQTTCYYCKTEIGRFWLENKGKQKGDPDAILIGAKILYAEKPFPPCPTCIEIITLYHSLIAHVPGIEIKLFPKPENGTENTSPIHLSPPNTNEGDTSMAESNMDVHAQPGGSSGPYHF